LPGLAPDQGTPPGARRWGNAYVSGQAELNCKQFRAGNGRLFGSWGEKTSTEPKILKGGRKQPTDG